MSVNNFKELEKLMISNRGPKKEATKNDINNTNNVFHLIGELIELYVGKMVNGFIGRQQEIGRRKEKDSNQ
jgi:hypothetical protein